MSKFKIGDKVMDISGYWPDSPCIIVEIRYFLDTHNCYYRTHPSDLPAHQIDFTENNLRLLNNCPEYLL